MSRHRHPGRQDDCPRGAHSPQGSGGQSATSPQGDTGRAETPRGDIRIPSAALGDLTGARR